MYYLLLDEDSLIFSLLVSRIQMKQTNWIPTILICFTQLLKVY